MKRYGARMSKMDPDVPDPDVTQREHSDSENSWNRTLSSTSMEISTTKIFFEAQIKHFLKVIKRERKASCDGEEVWRAVMVCDAIQISIKGSRHIEISMRD